jgi:hypothetical protein
VGEAIGAGRHGIVLRRCRRVCSEKFLLSGRERVRVGQFRGEEYFPNNETMIYFSSPMDSEQ